MCVCFFFYINEHMIPLSNRENNFKNKKQTIIKISCFKTVREKKNQVRRVRIMFNPCQRSVTSKFSIELPYATSNSV